MLTVPEHLPKILANLATANTIVGTVHFYMEARYIPNTFYVDFFYLYLIPKSYLEKKCVLYVS